MLKILWWCFSPLLQATHWSLWCLGLEVLSPSLGLVCTCLRFTTLSGTNPFVMSQSAWIPFWYLSQISCNFPANYWLLATVGSSLWDHIVFCPLPNMSKVQKRLKSCMITCVCSQGGKCRKWLEFGTYYFLFWNWAVAQDVYTSSYISMKFTYGSGWVLRIFSQGLKRFPLLVCAKTPRLYTVQRLVTRVSLYVGGDAAAHLSVGWDVWSHMACIYLLQL